MEEEKPRGRQSMRNANKVVIYNEEDYNSEDEIETKVKGRRKKSGRKKEGGRSKRKSGAMDDDDDDDDDPDGEPPVKKNRAEGGKVNRTTSDFDSIDFTSSKTTLDGNPWNLKISSWNVGGLKAWVKKNGVEYIKHEKPDILCIQEIKCDEEKIPAEAKVEGYHAYWLNGSENHSGCGLLTKDKPIDVKFGIGDEEFDSAGRLITAEFEKFYLVAAYVPNSGRGLVTLPKRMKWDPLLRSYLKELDSKKPVILCGDLNVAHAPIDLANPKTNTKNAGFTQEERDGFQALLDEGFIDSYRHLYPDKTGAYTFWTYMGNARSRNVGWRLDYFVLSERLKDSICDSIIRSEVYGSDHCPITLLVHI